MEKIRIFYKFLAFILCVLILLFFGFMVKLFYIFSIRKHQKGSLIAFWLTKSLVKILGFKITIKNKEFLQPHQSYMISSNHLSYLDIPILQSIIKNNCFISHYELKKNTPILYLMSQAAGSYFIERRNLKNIRKELRDIVKILKSNINIVFFPEGTSTKGEKLLPFHPPFFSASVLAKKNILPLCINYKKINNEPFCLKNRDVICWYREQTHSFKEHLFSVLALKSLEIEIAFLKPITVEGKKARELAEESYKIIDSHFHPAL